MFVIYELLRLMFHGNQISDFDALIYCLSVAIEKYIVREKEIFESRISPWLDDNRKSIIKKYPNHKPRESSIFREGVRKQQKI